MSGIEGFSAQQVADFKVAAQAGMTGGADAFRASLGSCAGMDQMSLFKLAQGVNQQAMSALRSGAAAAGASGGSAGGQLAGAVQGEIKELQGVLGQTNDAGAITQKDMLELQRAINTESQLFNTITNTQKAKHDAAMAAIQNTR